MGLDMYLTKETYVKNWDHMVPSERHLITIEHEDGTPGTVKPERISEIVEEVAYWRKANHIHAWFVDHVQGGKDECRKSHVSTEKLRELVEVCKVVINDPSKGPGLLQTRSGFFFGSTDYDGYYLSACEDTARMLEPLLNETGGYFYYRSSW